jgi:hypothetical protein
MDEVLLLIAEAFAETLFDLGEDVVEVSADKGIDRTSDASKEKAVFPTADHRSVAVGQFEAFAEIAVLILEFVNQTAEVVFDFTRSRVSRGIVAGVRNE